MNKDIKIKYRGYCFKLDARTVEALKKIRSKENITWNRLFFKMIKKYNKMDNFTENDK